MHLFKDTSGGWTPLKLGENQERVHWIFDSREVNQKENTHQKDEFK